MSSEVHGMEWFARTLRAWQLAILRFAVTLDNADRLAVLRIAREIDGPDPSWTAALISNFFAAPVQSFAPRFCSRTNLPPRSCDNIWPGSTMTVSSATFAAAIDAGQPAVSPISRPTRPRNNLWKGLSSRSNH